MAISFWIKLLPYNFSFKNFMLSKKNTPGLWGEFFFYPSLPSSANATQTYVATFFKFVKLIDGYVYFDKN